MNGMRNRTFLHLISMMCVWMWFGILTLDADDANGVITGAVVLKKGKIKTKGPKHYKDVVVYLETVGDNQFPPPQEHAKMDQRQLAFHPHVLAVQKGTTVDFLNNDTVKHNVFCPDGCCEDMNLGQWGRGETKSYTYERTGEGILLCKLHPEMAAYVIVLANPYFTMVEMDGKTKRGDFEIRNVPPGTYVVKTWHKKYKSDPLPVTVEDGESNTVLEIILHK